MEMFIGTILKKSKDRQKEGVCSWQQLGLEPDTSSKAL